ncbi:phage portal protein [Francisella philomiragia]|uniref:Phage portal protein, lambda family n=1 Tax=Francisella philomiragia TaxID=28110 RepID=A0A0B6CWK4_9GAMM|nr:phage portal protein [Francisella philomiragia]AJI53250.1 phage portal protein, lambda family [Francisella philomiragia]
MFGFKKKPQKRKIGRTGVVTEKRYYNSNSLIDKALFFIQNLTAKDIVTKDHQRILNSARYMYANNSYVKGYIGTMKRNVIGENGFALQMQTANNDFNNKVEKAWNTWCKAANCDTRKHSSFRDICNQVLSSLLIDGEAFIIINIKDKYPKLSVIDNALIDSSYNNESKNIINGIEVDFLGSPRAYYIKDNGSHKRILAENVIHIYEPVWAGQRRGISDLTSTISKLQKLDQFENSALSNAKNSAKYLGFIEKSLDPSMMEIEDDIVDDDGEAISQPKTRVEIEDSTIAYLENSETFKSASSQYPSGEFASFNRALLHSIAAGLNISYQALTRDINGTNYSGGRTATLEDQKRYKTLQNFIVNSFVEVVFDKWAEFFCLLNPSFTLSKVIENAEWQCSRWSWVDPKKEADANRILNELGVKTRKEIIKEMGKDPESTIAQILKERELFADEIKKSKKSKKNKEVVSNENDI